MVAVTAAVAAGMAGCRSMPRPSGAVSTVRPHEDSSDIVNDLSVSNGDALGLSSVNPKPSSQTPDVLPLTPVPEADSREPDKPFPTFNETGRDLCTDGSGRPLILLFSASSCPHCQWVGGVFDLIAGGYADRGLVAAHHYDIETGDDLLTEAAETRVPETHLDIGRRGDPDGYLPYFNFGCRYERIGTGYEEQDDLDAEAEEMRRVIEALLP